MRKRAILLLLLGACAAPLPPPAPEPRPEPDRNPWAGFAPGTWVAFEWGSLASENQHGLRPVAPDELTGFTAEGIPQFRSSSTFLETNRLLADGATEVRRARDSWTVAGIQIPCTVIDYEAPGTTLTLWRADAGTLPPWNCRRANNLYSLPTDVLHAVRIHREAHSVTTQILDLDDLHEQLTVGGRKLDCVVATMDSLHRQDDGRVLTHSWRMWLSADMPGGLVRRERQCTDSPAAKLHDYGVVDRVRDFHVVR